MFINTETFQKVSLHSVAKNHNVIFPREPTDEQLAKYNIARIFATPRPEGDVVTEGTPHQDPFTGKWRQVWSVREYTEEERQALIDTRRHEKHQSLNREFGEVLEQGLPWTINETSFTIQVRPQDHPNLIALRMEAMEALSVDSETPIEMEFRTQENTTVSLSPQEMVAMTTHALGYIKAQYKTLWALKDSLVDMVSLNDIETVSWPTKA